MKRKTIEKFELDDIDQIILDTLIDDARTSLTHMAHLAGTSRITVNKRISAMKEVGIIEGYTVMINWDLISKENK